MKINEQGKQKLEAIIDTYELILKSRKIPDVKLATVISPEAAVSMEEELEWMRDLHDEIRLSG